MKKVALASLGIGLVLIVLLVILLSQRSILAGVLPLVRPSPSLPAVGAPLPFELPAGFTARLFSDEVEGVRALTRDPRGVLLASIPRDGMVVALPDENGDGKADQVLEVLKGLKGPHGITFICNPENSNDCLLYVAEENAVRSYTYDAGMRKASMKETLAELPSGDGHSTRSLLPHPDGKRLLVSIGSSCNVCEESDPRRAAILAIDLATKEVKPFATGLRNTVFMDVHPVTGEIWGTEMGRDLLGDDLPPEEINIIREGAWYGWPWFYGKNVEDFDFSPNARPSFAQAAIPSYIDLQAHSAPLGLAFVPEEGWPEEYWYDLLVAFHGSWNRSVPTGYKIVRIPLDASGQQEGPLQDFMTGFMQDGTVIGRPAALLIEPGGTLYVSDDRAGAIYKITRQ